MPGPEPKTSTEMARRSQTRRARTVAALGVSASLLLAGTALPASGTAKVGDKVTKHAPAQRAEGRASGRGERAHLSRAVPGRAAGR